MPPRNTQVLRRRAHYSGLAMVKASEEYQEWKQKSKFIKAKMKQAELKWKRLTAAHVKDLRALGYDRDF
jgi:hypothetical protein